MTLKRLLLFFGLGLSLAILRAQCVQKGVVVAFDGEERLPLAGVTIVASGAATAVSDYEGKFQLKFNTLRPGELVRIAEIRKSGYAIFNSNSLKHWLISDNQTFTIVMSPEERMKSIRDIYMCGLSDNYSEQHQQYQDSIDLHHEQQLANLEGMRDTIALRYKTYAGDLLDIDQYARQRSNLVDCEGEVTRILQVRDRKLNAVDASRQRLLQILHPWTDSRDPDLWMRADSIYKVLSKRYGNDIHLRQQHADHIITIATRGDILDTVRLSQSLEPLVNILMQEDVQPKDEARARLTLVVALFRLGQISAGEEQFLKVWPLLEPLFKIDVDFYYEALVRVGLQSGHGDLQHPMMPLRVLFSARFIEWGCWDTGLDLLNDAYRETDNQRLRASIEEQMEIWGLLPDDKMNVEDEK